MKNIEFNLVNTPLYESMITYGNAIAYLQNQKPDNPLQVFDENDIKTLTEDVLTFVDVEFDEVSVQKITSEELYGYTDKIKVTIHCLGKAWETHEISYDRNKFDEFHDYFIIATINNILQVSGKTKRFFHFKNTFWNDEEGNEYTFSVNLLCTELELMQNLVQQLNKYDIPAELIRSKREYILNSYINLCLPSCIDTEKLEYNYHPEIPKGILRKNTDINPEAFTFDNFDTCLRKIGIVTFYLWCTVKQNEYFLAEVLAKYLNNKAVDLTKDDTHFTLYFEDREPLLIPKYIIINNDKWIGTSVMVAALNSLLRYYHSTKRIYFFNYDYRPIEHSNIYFICDLAVGDQIFELIKTHNGAVEEHFSRFDLYLLYEGEEFSVGINNQSKKKLLGVDVPQGKKWEDIFTLFLSLDSHKNMPTTKWYKSLREYITLIGEAQYANVLLEWIQKLMERTQQERPDYWQRGFEEHGWLLISNTIENNLKEAASPEWARQIYTNSYEPKEAIYTINGHSFYYTFGGRILRGIIHSGAVTNNKFLLAFIDEFALKNPDECTDVIHVYSQLSASEGVPRLTRLRAKIKKKNIQIRIETAMKNFGKKLQLTPDQVEEMSLADYGLDENHELTRDFGDFKAKFKISAYKKTSLSWTDLSGKVQTSIPAIVKNEYAQELKDLKADIKEIEVQLPIQKNRIEGFYLKDRKWAYHEWVLLYINHPLIGVIGKQLIWHFYDETQKSEGIWKDGQFVDVNENPIDWLTENTSVVLWHPIGFHANYIFAWRTYLLNNEITQPYKQAFREVYLLTDAESRTQTYSNRFAGHILNHDHFAALCKTRNWTPAAMASGMPTKRISALNMMVEYWVNEIWLGEYNSFYRSAHLSTDQVRFYLNKQLINLEDVPAIVFSELMRDIDLFVGVTSIANDPYWQDRGDVDTRNYWANYAFGDLTESSTIREEALKSFIPKLKIASKCHFEGRFLKVQGTLRNYKIHLGSGNILMEPNDQYLCIVADASKNNYINKLYLPFEGDNMLSIIISKALLLVNDDKIVDETITRQIKI